MSLELSDAQQFINWINTKSHLNAIASKASKRFVKRGQVYWCHFGLNVGSEMSKSTPRPAVIVSNYNTNKSSSNVIVVPVTHNKNSLPYLVPITPITDADGNIILDGQADTADIICISKARLGDLITTLNTTQMKDIDKSISISLELIHYYTSESEKYNKLKEYVTAVKEDRNKAQDVIAKIKETINQNGFNEKCQQDIKVLLDID